MLACQGMKVEFKIELQLLKSGLPSILVVGSSLTSVCVRVNKKERKKNTSPWI